MKQKTIPPLILCIFLCSIVYWVYLALNTTMVLECDALGYKDLGTRIKNLGFIHYFKTGPNREPIYPSIVSISMYLETFSGLPYNKIMAFFGVIALFLSQFLSYRILLKLNVRPLICAIILTYMGLSPAINNTAFSLYSEISAIPFILTICLLTAKYFEVISKNSLFQSFLWGIGLGLLFLTITMIKSIFEVIFFVFLSIYLVLLVKAILQKNRKMILNSLMFILFFVTIFEIPITTWKMLNLKYNNHYTLTNRGSWALYGSCALKTEPITPRGYLIALAHVPGKGACTKFFTDDECSYWEPNVTSDSLGMNKLSELNTKDIPVEEGDHYLMQESKKRIIQHPIQFTLLSTLDWIKMFFWESTKIGFVAYPNWLAKIYETGIFKDGLRLIISLATFISFIFFMGNLRNPLKIFNSKQQLSQELCICTSMFIIILSYTALHALFNTVPRWALPIAPLYLICIGYVLEQLWVGTKKKKKSAV